MNGEQRTPEQKLEVFAEYPGAEYEQEAQQRWGDTEAWARSRERTAAFGPADWTAVQADAEELESALAAAMTAGVTPDSDRARELVLQHRAWVGRFYDCDAVMHRSLGEMYVADERFAAHYDKRAPGLARWLREAINHAADAETASGI